MRTFLLSLCWLIVAGCGSEVPPETAGLPGNAAGVTLALGNPDARKGAGSTLTSLDTEHQQAIEQLIISARLAVDDGQIPQAIEALSQAIGIDPSDTRLFHMRADVYSMSGELASARADFSSAILADPANAELRNIRGYFLMTQGVHEDAVADFSEAIELDPKLSVAWNNRGLIYLHQGEYAMAVQQFLAAVDCDGEYVDGWNNLGFAYMKQDKLDQALQNIEQAIGLNPGYIPAWNNRGLINLKAKDYEAACTAFTRAIELADLDPRWYSHRQVVLQKLNRFDEAAADQQTIVWIGRLSKFNQHLNRDVRDAARWIARGDCLAKGDRYDAAISDYTNALKLEPDNIDALNARARVQAAIGELTKAMDDCDQSIFIQPTLEALSIRGDAWLAMNNLDQAIEDFEAAQHLDETFAETYRRRAEYHSSKGDKAAEEEDLKAAQRIEDALAGRLPAENTEPIPFPDSE